MEDGHAQGLSSSSSPTLPESPGKEYPRNETYEYKHRQVVHLERKSHVCSGINLPLEGKRTEQNPMANGTTLSNHATTENRCHSLPTEDRVAHSKPKLGWKQVLTLGRSGLLGSCESRKTVRQKVSSQALNELDFDQSRNALSCSIQRAENKIIGC